MRIRASHQWKGYEPSMSDVGQLVLIGITIAIEPLPIISFILVLSSRARTHAGWAFIAGWTGSLIVVVAIAVIASGGTGVVRESAPGRFASLAQLLLGLLLLFFGLRRMIRGAPPKKPSELLRRLESLTPRGAAAIGALMQPWPLVAAGCLIVLQADLRQRETLVAVVSFCLLASAGILGMQIFAIAAPGSAEYRLGALRGWIEAHRDAAVTWLAMIIGAWIAIQGAMALF